MHNILLWVLIYIIAALFCARRVYAWQRDGTDVWLLLDSLETCVCVSRFDTGEIVYANTKAREEFGLEEKPGQFCWELFREDADGPCGNCPKSAAEEREGSPLVWESYNTKMKKYYKNIERVITWNGIKSYMQHYLDLSESKGAEAALEAALENSKHLNDAKSEFLSRISHEIRTPMNAVIGMTKIAKQSNDASEIQSCLDNIDVSAKQLRVIINDIFDISKIESRTMELVNASFNFKKTMSAVYEGFKKYAGDKKQQLIFHPDDSISTMYIGDEARLSQVVGNLLSNAIKFTPEGGHITFSARQKECSNGAATVEISVADSGIGISKENIVKLFMPFEQLDGSKSRKYGGTGLGLVLSKNIVEMMGGEVGVKSDEGKGSTFTFTAKFALGNDIPKEDINPDNSDTAVAGIAAGEETDTPEPEKIEENAEKLAPSAEPGGHVMDFDDFSGLMPFINVKRGLENLKGNKKLYAVLLRSYQKNDFPERIEGGLAAADFKEAVQIAQALQNIAVSVGLDDLRLKAEMLEPAIRNLTVDNALMEKLKFSARETKNLIPDLIIALEEGKLS